MSVKMSLLPKEVTSLVHHIELNRVGWRDKTVFRLVLAAVWLSEHAPTIHEIHKILKNELRFSLNIASLSTVLDKLETQSMLLKLPEATYRIPDNQRSVFEKEIAETEKAEANARDFFFSLIAKLSIEFEPQSIWNAFETEFLAPLIMQAGASAYQLIAGEKMAADKDNLGHFLSRFSPESHPKLTDLVTMFLDPKIDAVRQYVSRVLHACFCIEASGLPELALQRLNAAVGKEITFRIFIDTNFLFSLLELHENPSNIAACELQGLIRELKSNLKIELCITSRTIEEAKSSIGFAKLQLSGFPVGQNFTQAALQIRLSGMAERFLSERLRRNGNLTIDEWFDPYLNDFATIARGKGIELSDEKLDSYATRQDVVDDITLILKSEEKRPPERRKSYGKIAHDMILWHFVNDKRSACIESPIDAREWILTVDFRLIGFDEHKQKELGLKIPLCLHPAALIQLLRFWVPRTTEFEEAILGSLRLPFLFQDFNVEAERTSLKILKGLGRFDGGDKIPEQTLVRVMLNEGLRSRLKTEQREETEIQLIRDALIEEMKARVDAEANKAQELHGVVKEKEAALITLQDEKQTKDEEIGSLRGKIAEWESRSKKAEEKITEQSQEIDVLKSAWQAMEETRKLRAAFFCYVGQLVAIISISIFSAWYANSLLLGCAKIVGPIPTRLLVAVLTFIIGHLFLEILARRNERMIMLWPFKQVSKFRKWLWVAVSLGLVVGVAGNLLANRIQMTMDHGKRLNAVSVPIVVKPNASIGQQT